MIQDRPLTSRDDSEIDVLARVQECYDALKQLQTFSLQLRNGDEWMIGRA
jgi:hypothetical protein